MDLYRRIIDELAADCPDTELWMTFYGEALLLGYRLFYLIHYAKKAGINYVVLNSNAALLSEEKSRMLVDSGLDRFIISFDGHSPEVYNKIRVPSDYETVVRNIEGMMNVLDKTGSRMRFELQFSEMDENTHERAAFKDYWMGRGVMVKVREKLTWAGTVEAPNLDPGRDRIACPWAMRTAAVHWNGDMAACAVDYDGGFVAGNVGRDSVLSVWQGAHRRFRRIHLERRFEDLPELCRGCLDWQAVGAVTYDPATGGLAPKTTKA